MIRGHRVETIFFFCWSVSFTTLLPRVILTSARVHFLLVWLLFLLFFFWTCVLSAISSPSTFFSSPFSIGYRQDDEEFLLTSSTSSFGRLDGRRIFSYGSSVWRDYEDSSESLLLSSLLRTSYEFSNLLHGEIIPSDRFIRERGSVRWSRRWCRGFIFEHAFHRSVPQQTTAWRRIVGIAFMNRTTGRRDGLSRLEEGGADLRTC